MGGMLHINAGSQIKYIKKENGFTSNIGRELYILFSDKLHYTLRHTNTDE